MGFVNFMWIGLGLFILCGLGWVCLFYVDWDGCAYFMWIGMGFVVSMWIGLILYGLGWVCRFYVD